MQQNGDLSVEEILESIKKVIARDNKDSALAERHRRESDGVVLRGPGASFGLSSVGETVNDDDLDDDDLDDESGEVLELGDAATEFYEESAEPAVADSDSQPEIADEPAEIEAIETDFDKSPDPDAEAEAEQLAEAGQIELVEAPITSEPEAPAIMEEPSAAAEVSETAADEGDTPLERMVRESIRPMLREWLDTNLPPIVERMVTEELGRIMGKSR